MSTTKFQPIRGFRDLYPPDKAVQSYIFNKLKTIARLFGYEEYDGPILEPMEIYLGKTSEELIKRQTFQITNQKEQTLILRPEMTPSLARMIAAKEQQLIFPLRFFNLGLRFRLEAPQKGREREFYQADFDLLGAEGPLADAEILNLAVNLFLQLGATDKDFVVYINSRIAIQQKLAQLGVRKESINNTITVIDKKEKVKQEAFVKMLCEVGVEQTTADLIVDFLENPSDYASYFNELFSILKLYDIDKYIKINPAIVRGLDYYTGLAFEAKEKGSMTRSLLGGGRYDNLIENCGASRKISGVGFATSDVILWEFLKDKNLIPALKTKSTKVLVTIFPQPNHVGTGRDLSLHQSINIVNQLRQNNISTELYPDTDKKLDKQLKYADKNNIPYVVIVGPEEIEHNTIKVKNMQTGEQKNTSLERLSSIF